MKKSTIWLIIIVMTLAFSGLLFMQVSYISTMYRSRNEQFNETVRRTLDNVSRSLEYDEARRILLNELIGTSASVDGAGYGSSLSSSKSPLSGIDISKFQLDQLPSSTRREHALKQDKFLSTSTKLQEELFRRYKYQQGLVNEVILDMITSTVDKPIYERVRREQLQNTLEYELLAAGINLYYIYDIVDSNNHSYFSTGKIPTNKPGSTFSQVVFRNDRPSHYHYIRLYFPGKKGYIYETIDFLIPSILFTVLLFITFAITIFIVLRQRKLAELKNDFVNNMTHELKTPVSTIRLANEFLMDNSLSLTKEQVSSRLRVINQETERLSNLVDQVLHTTLLDSNSTVMKMEELDIQELILDIANTYSIKVEGMGGQVDIELDALDNDIYVNKTHMTNIITNLMDNAIKYRRPDVPLHLEMGTKNEDNQLCIYIKDNGIGIKKEYLKKIFDRFFRVPTGNVHDVKGYGLGLSYVAKLVKEMGGHIKAESEYGKGTTFTIYLPLLNK